MSKRVVILGGGVAGLAAAYRLLQLQPDWQVTILEKAERVGGLAVGWRNQEFAADLGPHRIYTELPEIEALLPELISKDQMLTVQRRSELLLNGHFYQYPVRASELLRVMGIVRMTRFGLSAVAGKLRGLMGRPRNYEDAMIANFGRAVYEVIVEPYTRKVWKIAPRDLSDEVARVRVSAGNVNRLVRQLLSRSEGRKGTQSALSSFAYIRGGVEGLVKSLESKAVASGTRIETLQDVTGFAVTDDSIAAVETHSGSVSERASVDYVISTLPITDLVEMLQQERPEPGAAEAAKGLVYVGLILVALIVRRAQFSTNSWIYFPEEEFVFNRSYEPRNFDPSMAPADRTMVVFEVTARWDEDLWKRSDPEIIQRVTSDALRTGLLREDEIETAFSVRVPHTYPLYSTDYQARLSNVFGYLRQFSNLVTTGRQGLFNHNNMDHSMLMGIRAAETISDAAIEHTDAAAHWYDNLEQFKDFRIVD
ncbi:MAG: FAD-dependent oxidoreductase [Candidatus Sumerlaeaceae bacterium]